MTVALCTQDDQQEQSDLRLEVQRRGHAVIVTAVGEIDTATIEQWRSTIDDAVRAVRPGGAVIVALAGVDFIGVDGMRVVADAARRCGRCKRTLCVVDASPLVRRVLVKLAPSSALELDGDVETAFERSGQRSADAEDDGGYEHLEHLFTDLAVFDDADPQRAVLRQDIIRRAMRLAENIAHRFGGRGEPQDDLLQVARLGLIQAVDRFDPTNGSDFLAFAVPTIMGEVRRHFRDRTWGMRVPRPVQETYLLARTERARLAQDLGRDPTPKEIAESIDKDVEQVVEALLAENAYQVGSIDTTARGDDETPSFAERIGTADRGYEHIDEYLTVKPLLTQLPERDRKVLVMRFFESMTQSQIADEIGVSQMQVSRILSKTLARLREESMAD